MPPAGKPTFGAINVSSMLFVFFATLIAGGIFSYEHQSGIYYKINFLPSNLLVESASVLIASMCARDRAKRLSFSLTFAALCTIFYSLIYGHLWSPSPYTALDFLVLYKAHIYLVLLFLVGGRRFTIYLSDVEKLCKLLIFAFLIKYAFAKFVFGVPRPGLFVENNFELILVFVLFAYLRFHGSMRGGRYLLALSLIAVLSGSKSGVLTLVLLLFLFLDIKNVWLLLAICALAALFLFLDVDAPAYEQVDRYKFMLIFFDEFSHGNIWEILLGRPPMTPLSDVSCSSLSFYSSMFSSADPQVCYSVVLHVYYFRALLDHGVLGTCFLIASFYFLLKANLRSSRLASSLVLIAMVNGLSVSGFSNAYFIMGLLIVCMAKNDSSYNCIAKKNISSNSERKYEWQAKC